MKTNNIDKIKLNNFYDRRIKLTDKQREEIKEMYKKGIAIREIARNFEEICSRRLIQFVIYPERDKKLKEIRKIKKGHLFYYNKNKHKEAMRSIRKYKEEVFTLYFYIMFTINC